MIGRVVGYLNPLRPLNNKIDKYNESLNRLDTLLDSSVKNSNGKVNGVYMNGHANGNGKLNGKSNGNGHDYYGDGFIKV